MSDLNQSHDLFQRSLKIVPGGVHSPVRACRSALTEPIFFLSAKGAKITSVDGEEFIDFCMSFGPLILGHRDPDVCEHVHRIIQKVWTLGACEPYSLELAEWITQKVKGAEKIRFVSSGTEAVMSALRLARAYTGRNKILKFEGCYHGHVDSMLVRAGSGLAGSATGSSGGIGTNASDETLIAPLDSELEISEIFEKWGGQIAAVIIEPLPCNHGLLIQRSEFLDHVARLAKKNRSLLILDEVISGFRVALGGMAQIENIDADLLIFGKIIGGGFPVGAFAGRKEIMDLLAPQGPVYQAGTLSAHPVGMQAGLATLKKSLECDVYALLEKRTQGFADDLNEFFCEHSLPWQVSSYQSIFWLHPQTLKDFRKSSEVPSALIENFAPFFKELLAVGIYFPPSPFEVGFMSWAHTDSILAEAIDKIKSASMKVRFSHAMRN